MLFSLSAYFRRGPDLPTVGVTCPVLDVWWIAVNKIHLEASGVRFMFWRCVVNLLRRDSKWKQSLLQQHLWSWTTNALAGRGQWTEKRRGWNVNVFSSKGTNEKQMAGFRHDLKCKIYRSEKTQSFFVAFAQQIFSDALCLNRRCLRLTKPVRKTLHFVKRHHQKSTHMTFSSFFLF